jgi:N-glycosylase/DNA lyase
MTIPGITLVVGAAALTASLALLVARLLSYRLASAGDASGEFSMERYEPMLRMMDRQDAEFLARQPGAVESGSMNRLRRRRRRIFRLYLRELAGDFQRMHAQAREIAAGAPEQRADVVVKLVRQQIEFWAAMAVVETQLALDFLGLGRVNPQRLVKAAEALRASLQAAAPAAGPIPV